MAQATVGTREHRGEYGYDGSFETVSAGTQLAVVGAGSTALLVAAGVCLARGRPLAAALAAASAVNIAGTAACFLHATRSGRRRVGTRSACASWAGET